MSVLDGSSRIFRSSAREMLQRMLLVY